MPPLTTMSKDHALPPARSSALPVLSLAAVLYFSEGLPYGIVTELLPLYLRLEHVRLIEIGLLSAVGSAWTLKFLWSPLVDLYGTYRRWIAGALVAITLSIAGIGLAPAGFGYGFWIVISVLALASATQDLAVDAFTIRATPAHLVGPVNSVRVIAYRVAIIAGGAGLAALGGTIGWRQAFIAGALLSSLLLLVTMRIPEARGSGSVRHDLLRGLAHWLQRPSAALLLGVVFLYKLGEFAIVAMIKPYWVDRGYSATEIATVTTLIGVIVTIAGAVAGGAFVARFGVYRGLLWLGLSQVVSNLGYAVVSTTSAGRPWMYTAAVLENFAYGLGTAAFLAFLMAICDRERAATEFALLSATYGIARVVSGAASGFIIQRFGYPAFFWLAVALGLPALLLIPAVREELARRVAERRSEEVVPV